MSIFWLPQGPKNPPQSAFWAKSWFPKSMFYTFFGRSCIFCVFCLFWGHVSMNFRCFCSMHFSTSPFVFSKPPNLQSHRHGQCFEHFSCFPLFCFLAIFCWKNRPKMEPWKNVEKQALPASKMVPKALRIHAPNPENPENGLQNLNFEKSIFLMIFEVSKKQNFGRFWVPKLKRCRSLLGNFFDIFRLFLLF